MSHSPASFGEYPYTEIDTSSWALTGAKNRDARAIYSCARDEKKHIQKTTNMKEESENEIFEKHFKNIDEDDLTEYLNNISDNEIQNEANNDFSR